MTPETGILAHIARAEDLVRDARGAWDPTSLTGCAGCAEALRRAVAEMQAACEIAVQGQAPPEAKARLERLWNDVNALASLVDAAMAFSRGLDLHSGEELAHSEVEG